MKRGFRTARILVCGLAVLSALGAPAAWAQSAPSGAEVMRNVFSAPKPRGATITMSMVVTKNGQSLSRTLTTWTTGDNAKGQVEKTLMKFLSPADVRGSGFLTAKKPDGSTESLLWLPALGRVRRLGSGASDQDQAFFGSDFTNRDINGFNEADFSYSVQGRDGDIYTVVATPKKDVGYEKLVYQVDSTIWKYIRIEYWRSGRLVKTQTDEYGKVGDYIMPTRIVMSSASKSSTEIRFSDYKLDQDLNDQVFTERHLKQ